MADRRDDAALGLAQQVAQPRGLRPLPSWRCCYGLTALFLALAAPVAGVSLALLAALGPGGESACTTNGPVCLRGQPAAGLVAALPPPGSARWPALAGLLLWKRAAMKRLLAPPRPVLSPAALRPGERVGLVAAVQPSRPLAGWSRGWAVLRDWGLWGGGTSL